MSENGLKTIILPTSLTVRELAQLMEASPIQVIKVLMTNGVMANINQQIDFDTAAIVASELGFEAAMDVPVEEMEIAETGETPLWRRQIDSENPSDLVARAPVVTILGHVDHGKTTLLDAIRHTSVASGEAGGITQHIGAYQVEHKGQLITFLDTPGHAAFTAMRSRGAQGADIVILVVAADDGVMPQTKEAISHAKAARVPIIVALNKMDRPDANPDFTKKQLAESGLVPDDWDGDTMVVPVSAKQKTGIDDLLEAILLTAEGLTILANPSGQAIGTVIEAEIDRAKGVLATLLVQNGTVNMGDVIVAGTSYGRIRAMFDYKGKPIRKAGPSTPVLVMGLNDVPHAGDIFQAAKSTKLALVLVEERRNRTKERISSAPKATLEELFDRVQSGEEKELRLIIKADVQGSLEPIINSLTDLSTKLISINILHAEAGNISENDVMLAVASQAIVVGFNVSADSAAKKMAEAEGVSIRLYSIIYRLIEDVEKAMKGMLEPEYIQVILGEADVLAVFKITKVGVIAGCRVTKGEIRRNAKARLLRNEEEIFNGEIASLKHEKDDVREVRAGFECGIGLKGFNEIETGDIIQCYSLELATT
ncbi:MAG: translation initiation factor IF-2 [Chloroflexi bacterium 44-23]|nr:MAG: translation initiation factor IF-2 [Chloroflexi bacterium 44-23]